ncbi:MAG: alpha/beta hydrolase [Alphaproteobacteria bacterium]|nr:alpha/beta hydrolase [Alphaproteobacteria bacterium]
MASPAFGRVLAHIAAKFGGGTERELTDDEYVAASRAANDGYAAVDGVEPVPAPDTRIVPVDAGGVPAEWVLTPRSDPDRRLLWIHGGGWVACHPVDYRNINEVLAREAGAAVLAIDYRLAPEHPFPAGLDDCATAYRWLRDNGPEGRARARAVWLTGDSAGGNLALALMLRLKREGAVLPAAAATLGAATDLTGVSPSMVTRADADIMVSKAGLDRVARLYVRDGTPLNDPLVSPLYGDLAGMPPLRMHVGDREVLLDDTLRFVERARAAGVHVETQVWPEMIHVFEGFCHMLPEGRASLEAIAAFLRARA